MKTNRTLLGVATGWMAAAFLSLTLSASAEQNAEIRLTDVPDYDWYAGCFGTATGNLMGYWDRHGLPNVYAGPTGGGLAPLDSRGANSGIRSLWVSKAGVDGRPANQPGHMDDYYVDYERTDADPYVTAGRPEHAPDCVGDFIGLNQRKWVNMAGECDGNIDAYSFVYWATNGDRRVNYALTNGGVFYPDIQAGLRLWMRSRGYDADVFTQLPDFNPTKPLNRGFTFENLKAEINAGFPVLIFLQPYDAYSRSLPGMARANPIIHGMMIYGYQEFPEFGIKSVYYQTSWGVGEHTAFWGSQVFEAGLPVRGIIGFRPRPRIRSVNRAAGVTTLSWDGPISATHDALTSNTAIVSRYQVQRSSDVRFTSPVNVGPVTTNHTANVVDAPGATAFYRVQLLAP